MNKKGLFLVLAILIASSLVFFGCVKILTSIGDDGDHDGDSGGEAIRITIDYRNGSDTTPVNWSQPLVIRVFNENDCTNPIVEKSSVNPYNTFYLYGLEGLDFVYFIVFVDVGNNGLNGGDVYIYNNNQSINNIPLSESVDIRSGEINFTWGMELSAGLDWYLY